jgi:hypothetical protein
MEDNYTIVTPTQLDNILYNSVMQLSNEVGMCKPLFELLYNTGVRVNEAFNILLWYEFDKNNYRLLASKGSAERIISKSLVPPTLRQFYASKTEIRESSISMLNYDFKRYLPVFHFGTAKTAHWQHSFRYNYIKRMSEIYRDVKLLKTHIGHIKVESTLHYLNAEIFTKDPSILFVPEK